MRPPRARRVYCTLRKSFTIETLLRLGFVRNGSLLVRRVMRKDVAVASSSGGTTWRVTHMVRFWKPGGRS